MVNKSEHPEGWHEPINEALWRYDLLGGCPRWTYAIHFVVAALVVFDAIEWVFLSVFVHGAVLALTKREPEWPAIVWGWWKEPGELEP